MKIVDVKSMVLGTAWRNLAFVQVITDEGLVGVERSNWGGSEGVFTPRCGDLVGVELGEAESNASPQRDLVGDAVVGPGELAAR